MRICTHALIGNKKLITVVGLRGGRPTTFEFCTKCTYCCCLVAKSHRWLRWLLKSHGLQPTSLLCPWDCSGKNTWAGCHAHSREKIPFSRGSSQSRTPKPGNGYFPTCAIREADVLCWAVFSRSVLYNPLQSHGQQPARLLCPWGSPGKNTGVGCHALHQRIFPAQGLTPGLPHCRQILYCLSPLGSPRILEWVACPFCRDLPNPGIAPGSPALQMDSLPAELPEKTREADIYIQILIFQVLLMWKLAMGKLLNLSMFQLPH